MTYGNDDYDWGTWGIGGFDHHEIEKPVKRVFVTRDGRRLTVGEYENQHLINTIRFLIRTGKDLTKMPFLALMQEAQKRKLNV